MLVNAGSGLGSHTEEMTFPERLTVGLGGCLGLWKSKCRDLEDLEAIAYRQHKV